MNDTRLQDLLNEAQKNTKDPAVYKRITAVKCVLIKGMTIREVGDILCKAPSWVSRCVTRFEEGGRDPASLETRPRSGRPPKVKWDKVMKYLSRFDPMELTRKRTPEIIYQKTRVRFTVVHVHNMMKGYNFTLKKSVYVHPKQASKYMVKKFQQNAVKQARNLAENRWIVLVMDESQFVEGTKDRDSHYSQKGERIHDLRSGRRSSTTLFGGLASDGTQCFRIARRANSDSFIDYLKDAERKYQYVVVIMDNAPWHKSKKVVKFLEEHPNIMPIYLPVGAPQLNPVVACWKVGKKELCSKYYETFPDFIHAIREFFRTYRFHYDIWKFLMRKLVSVP